MKKYVLIIAICFMIHKGWTQNTNLDYRYAMKLYNLTSLGSEYFTLFSVNDSVTSYGQVDRMQLIHPTIAFQWKTKKNNLREIEITHFQFGKARTEEFAVLTTDPADSIYFLEIENSIVKTTLIALRYEYILNFCKRKEKRFVPSLGFSVSPFYRETRKTSRLAGAYSSFEHYSGVRAYFTPRLTYYCGKRAFIDLNIPICVVNLDFRYTKTSDPSVAKKTHTEMNPGLSPIADNMVHARIGIGIKL